MRIGLISQWYEPEPGAAAHPAAIARALARRGNEMTVLTGFPNYPEGKIYDGYRMSLRYREVLDGVHVVRVPLAPSHDASAPKRMVALSSFAASASAQVGVLRRSDVCLVYLTPATVGVAARLLRSVMGIPYVLYVQDLWPDSVTASGFVRNRRVESFLEAGINRYCRSLYRDAQSIAAISPSMAQVLVARGAEEARCEVVYNWVDEGVFRPVERRSERGEFDPASVWIMYAGGMGDVQGLGTAIEALSLLRERPDIKLALVGDGVALPSLLAQARSLGVAERVVSLGRRPMDEMPSLMAGADAQLISLRDLPLFHATIPSKTQSAMASGLPIVCSVPGDTAGIVEKAGAGFAAPPGDVEALASAMLKMANAGRAQRLEMGRASRVFYQENFAEAVGASRLESMLSRAAVERRRR